MPFVVGYCTVRLMLVPRREPLDVTDVAVHDEITERTVSVPLVALVHDIERNRSMCALAIMAARVCSVPPPVRRVTNAAPPLSANTPTLTMASATRSSIIVTPRRPLRRFSSGLIENTP